MMIKICKCCKRAYESTNTRQQYCSRKCKTLALYHRTHEQKYKLQKPVFEEEEQKPVGYNPNQIVAVRFSTGLMYVPRHEAEGMREGMIVS